ncbi:YSIRK-type signal peptide-containing protein, partial [Staphylococcus felis]
MARQNKSKNSRLDFLPNRANKYAIRRFTVGTASILIGSILFLGTNQNEAKAAEASSTSDQVGATAGQGEASTNNAVETGTGEVPENNTEEATKQSAGEALESNTE